MLSTSSPRGATKALRGANPWPSCAKTVFSARRGLTARFPHLSRSPTATFRSPRIGAALPSS
eukprot:3377593-Pyramimonas_sp.AAC.1